MSIINAGLSGLKAASINLSIIGNNIANSTTVGFKQSRTDFSDVYSSTISGLQVGNGVAVASITQDLSQGGVNHTGRALDLAIEGDSYFTLRNVSGETIYSRAGNFDINKDGNIVNLNGDYLQGYLAVDGSVTGSIGNMHLDTTPLAAKSTTQAQFNLNLDATETTPPLAFDKTDPTTYNTRSSMEIFDSLGNSHSLSTYFVKTAANTWDVHVDVDGSTLGNGTISFDSFGQLSGASGLTGLSWIPGGGAAGPQAFDVRLDDCTQYGIKTQERGFDQDGYSAGSLTGFNVDGDGLITGRYSNGQNMPLGQLALAKFANPQGLISLGNNAWVPTTVSGDALISKINSLGAVNPGALEDSNVDLARQMVQLISAQRTFQVNAKSIQASDTLTQTILQLQ